MEAFKNPLTPEEEKKYIALCLSGDKAARSILIEYNLRLVAHISRKYNSAVRDPEDLLSIGTIGLIKAIDSYKPDKGCKLSRLCRQMYRKRASHDSPPREEEGA